jgi:hypothetical protein
MWRSTVNVEEYGQCGGVLSMWRSTVNVEEYCQCGAVRSMWRSTVNAYNSSCKAEIQAQTVLKSTVLKFVKGN